MDGVWEWGLHGGWGRRTLRLEVDHTPPLGGALEVGDRIPQLAVVVDHTPRGQGVGHNPQRGDLEDGLGWVGDWGPGGAP